MGLEVVTYASDKAPPTAERRVVHIVVAQRCRVAVVSVAGGMMDIGWAQHLLRPATEVARRFADSGADFSAESDRFVRDLRQVLTAQERDHRRWCSAEFLLLDVSTDCLRTARLGGLRLWGWGPGSTGPIGREDVLALSPGSPPVICTASLIPDTHWMVAAAGGWQALDEKQKADRMASQVCVETLARRGLFALALMSHPFWTAVPSAELVPLSSLHDVARVLDWQVKQATSQGRPALVTLVRLP